MAVSFLRLRTEGDYAMAAALYQEKVRVQELLLDQQVQAWQQAFQQQQFLYQQQQDALAARQYQEQFDYQKLLDQQKLDYQKGQDASKAAEEGISYTVNYIADKLARDPNAKWDWDEFRNAVASGGVSGMFFGLGGSFVGGTSANTSTEQKNTASTSEAGEYYFDAADTNNSWKDRTYTQGDRTFIQSSDRLRMYEVPKQDDIKYFISSDGTVELNDDVFSEVDGNDYRDFVKAYAELNLVTHVDAKTGQEIDPKPIIIESDGTRVIITQTGINDVAKKIRSAGIKSHDNVSSILLLNRIIQNAQNPNGVANKHGRQTPFTDYKAKFSVGGRTYDVLLHVKNSVQGDRYHYHTLEEIEVEPTDGSNGADSAETYQANSTSATIIPQTGNGGNTQFALDGPRVSPQAETIARYTSDLDTLQRQNGVDALEAEYQKYLAEEAAENTRAYLESEFQDVLEKARNGDTILLSEEMEDHLAQKPYSEIEGLNGKLSNRAVRKWYLAQNAKILETVSTEGTLEERARRAFDLRNQNRVQARDMMQDQKARAKLDADDANATFEEKMADKMSRKGMTWEEALRDVLATAGETRKSVNKMLGLED